MAIREPVGGVIAWGVVGENRWESLRSDRNIDREGVVRDVEPGVDSILDARDVDTSGWPFPAWKRVKKDGRDGRFEMDLGDGPAPPLDTFADLRDSLHRRGKAGLRDGPELDRLDRAAVGLLRTIGRIHREGIGVGLLRPSSVILAPSADHGILLPDVGFVRFRGLLPPWMTPTDPFRDLWDKPPEWINERSFDRERYPKLADRFADSADRVLGSGWDPRSDLRTAARLIAWVLAPGDRVLRTIPSRDEADWTRAEVWAVLRDALEGRFATADEFADALETGPARPSRHFIEQISGKGPSGPHPMRNLIWAATAIVPLLAIPALAYFLWPTGVESGGNPICPECPPSSKLQPLLIDYLKAENDPWKEAELLEALYQPGLLNERQGRQKAELECLHRLTEGTQSRLGRLGEELPRVAHESGMAWPEARRKAAELKAAHEKLFDLQYGRSPKPEESAPWLKRLAGLGYF
ncbi:MAG: hypothetical protein U0800_06905 [Isosphaeraceae bacterium]